MNEDISRLTGNSYWAKVWLDVVQLPFGIAAYEENDTEVSDCGKVR